MAERAPRKSAEALNDNKEVCTCPSRIVWEPPSPPHRPGCASPACSAARRYSSASAAVDSGELGLATKAQVALVANDIATALALPSAPSSIARSDAGFRALARQ